LNNLNGLNDLNVFGTCASDSGAFVVSIVFVESRELKMNFTFLVAVALLFPVWSWLDTEVKHSVAVG